ncbi:hypothetical protein [Ralstonia pseudosolanacearum]|uniref:Uncharacterized protein n=3 Tax=root TaxID=1 RepID=A0A077K9R7_9CAUD|nr:hypothetical protein [Ralstonia pseudosolanacearum]YP_009067093.1 signal peptide motif [Ralstonia phage RSY1]APC68790.1 hypothetical protein RSOE_17630 [Ralstonia solanacearum OE1-1]OIN75353.1 hypothetical protein BL247_01445 [Ralstonia solanacearum]API74480.1 hypothetical protein AC251_07850 [Ralstonia pseudosolanacearum]QKL92038.1 hypothetical protein HI802_07920 [Ralstonia solanacearum]QKL97113.1 hypothetical protein HI801_07920 [Ralstonia solanacearum]
MNRAFAVLCVLAAVAGLGVWLAHSYAAAVDRADTAEKAAADLRTQLKGAQGSTVTVTQYVDRVQTIRLKGDTIIKEIPRYVPIQADASCVVPRGFVRLHDAAAADAVPDPGAGDADAAPSGVALSAVAGTVADNYTDSHANSAQLTALQQLLRDQGVTVIGEGVAP